MARQTCGPLAGWHQRNNHNRCAAAKEPCFGVLTRTATVPALSRERRKPFRLYINNVVLMGEASWRNLAAVGRKHLTGRHLPGSEAVRLLISGPALTTHAVRKEQVSAAVHCPGHDSVLPRRAGG